jgi:hypothetical protein
MDFFWALTMRSGAVTSTRLIRRRARPLDAAAGVAASLDTCPAQPTTIAACIESLEAPEAVRSAARQTAVVGPVAMRLLPGSLSSE